MPINSFCRYSSIYESHIDKRSIFSYNKLTTKTGNSFIGRESYDKRLNFLSRDICIICRYPYFYCVSKLCFVYLVAIF